MFFIDITITNDIYLKLLLLLFVFALKQNNYSYAMYFIFVCMLMKQKCEPAAFVCSFFLFRNSIFLGKKKVKQFVLCLAN